MTTRHETPEGFLRAGAILTRSGPIVYTRGELGLDGDQDALVTVNRTKETLSHPDTLASLRGGPITLGHPKGGVNPDNFQDVVVGAIAGEPRIEGDYLVGDVLVGDAEALRRLDEGVDELSIDYRFSLGEDFATIGPMLVNHTAILPKGRAGSAVRVLDSPKEDTMPLTAEQIAEINTAVNTAIQAGAQKLHGADGGTNVEAAMGEALRGAMAPVLAELQEVKAAQDAAAAATAKAEAEAQAKAAADALVTATRTEERERFAILSDAMPFIPEDKRAGLEQADPKAILTLALGDSIPNAAEQSTDFLRGALASAKANARANAPAGGGPGVVLPGEQTVVGGGNGAALPAGVQAFDSARNNTLSAADARAQAQRQYEEAMSKRYTESGGR